MDDVPISNSANPHCPKFDDLIKFDQEHQPDISNYEELRTRNIERNKLILRSLGLNLLSQEMKLPTKATKKEAPKPKKELPPKILPKRNRSQSQLQDVTNNKESQDEQTNINSVTEKPQQQWNGENIFGAIPGVPIGTHWETRMDCCYSGVHRHTVAGIHWGPEGAYSVALSGGYEDDIDVGDSFTYTGEGGRDLKGTKNCPKNLRTAPQSKDQVLERGNLALAKSCTSKKPVRVIRGYKLKSEYAPESGYRYDGLYTIKHYWQDIGLSGHRVFKYVFVRCADQGPPPWKTEDNNKEGSVASDQNGLDLLDSIANEEAIEVGNKILKMFGEDPQSDNDNNATVLDTTNPSYADLIGGWPSLAAFPDPNLDDSKNVLPLAQFTPSLDLDNSMQTEVLPLSIPAKVTFVPGNSAEDTSKHGKAKQKRKQENGTQPTKKRARNETQHTNDVNNNNTIHTNSTTNNNSAKKNEKPSKKEKFSRTLKNGEIVCCRAPENPSNDYYWLAKVHLKRDAQTISNTRQKIQVQWFEKDPSGREMHYYLSTGFDKIEAGCIYHQGFQLKEVPLLALYRLEEDLRKYDQD